MTAKIPYTLTHESINVVVGGKSHTIKRDAPNFKPLKRALVEERWEEVPNYLTVSRSVEQWSNGKFRLSGGDVFYNNEKVDPDLARRIVAMVGQGRSPEPLFKFWERLQQNPSWRSVQQLWSFLKHENIPLTVDGCFLAYKGVRNNYKDQHSGKFDNSPGAVHKMPRNKISDDPQQACHVGFHVGAIGYARNFSERVVVCKVDPQDVVCVPYDHGQQKMRVCKYEVIGNYGADLPDIIFEEDKYDAPLDLDDEEVTDREETEDEINTSVGASSGAPVAVPKGKKTAEKRKAKKGFSKYDKKGFEELMALGIAELRTYAYKGLDIVGASKIPGGKIELVKRILEVRE